MMDPIQVIFSNHTKLEPDLIRTWDELQLVLTLKSNTEALKQVHSYGMNRYS